jgi:hypothetical protein
MKAKGEFETAKKMYRKALLMNSSDGYAKTEISKLNVITEPRVVGSLDDILVRLASKTAK